MSELETGTQPNLPLGVQLKQAQKEIKALKEELEQTRESLGQQEKTHKKVMKHWLDTNKGMMKKANDHYEGVEKENTKFKKALEWIEKVASERCGDAWYNLRDYAKDALK